MIPQPRAVGTLFLTVLTLTATGCSFGPRALEDSHGRYNTALKQVFEEQLLLNLVRVRYNDDPVQLDVSSIAAQYELSSRIEAQPFFNSQAARVTGPPPYETFTSILPFANLSGSNRPTLSLTPLLDPDTIRSLFRAGTLDGIIFLAESGWPVATVFRLWVDYLNGVPNAVAATGPPRDVASPFREFRRAVELLQVLQDRGDLRFVREEKFVELGAPFPAANLTPALLMEAEHNGYEYRARPDNTWVLVKRDHTLQLRINPTVAGCPEMLELAALLHLTPGATTFEVTVGVPDLFPSERTGATMTLNLFPRSTVQTLFYLSYGVEIPQEHLQSGVARQALAPEGNALDWTEEATAGLFTVHSCKQLCRPANAWVAVKYRGYWFYIDDRDNDSKITFTFMMVMTRANLLVGPKTSPTLTLPVGR
jgi:hypothetical protein